jgi:ubiquinone/menaquinone biosynthesis C-methylase UbiE
MTAAVSASAESQPIAAYDTGAREYDWRTSAFQSYRRRILAALEPTPGTVVLDVGCGTGLCFSGLATKVGQAGRVVGIDESPAMLSIAKERAASRGWDNFTFVESPAEWAEIPVAADAALFCAVHDILQSPAALQNVFAHLKPGGWVVAGGGKFTSSLPGLNMQIMALHRPYIRSFDGFERPWNHLEHFAEGLTVAEFAYGTGYVAVGRAPNEKPSVN